MEERLAPLYAGSVVVSIALFMVGVFFPPVLWAGVAVLVVMPLLSACVVVLEARRNGDGGLVWLVVASLAGVAAAVLLGLSLRR